MTNQCGFIILSGGLSSRMGTPKFQLLWGGITFLDCLASKAADLGFGEVYLSANVPVTGWDIIRDERPEIGPMEGIYQCLKKSRYQRNFVVSVDLPQLPPAVIVDMLNLSAREDADCVFLRTSSGIEPLCSVFTKAVIPHFEAMMEEENYSVRQAGFRVKTMYYDYQGDEDDVSSMNTPEEYHRLLARYF